MWDLTLRNGGLGQEENWILWAKLEFQVKEEACASKGEDTLDKEEVFFQFLRYSQRGLWPLSSQVSRFQFHLSASSPFLISRILLRL